MLGFMYMTPPWILHQDLKAQGFKGVNLQTQLCTKTACKSIETAP